ncbi:hypothetical protein EW026_g4890 [Hermanssonia centrifuga]|uniref:Uncharacterized protein n=1 Tax=Hermanssonia centrifuga TaxID=98765 RepID=A0A4S4KGD2_9APHY|nr:hypothetical protein EW026_g4890 [Hermanssonia centrifuga]
MQTRSGNVQPNYAFLSQPPSSKKRSPPNMGASEDPSQALAENVRRRSSTVASVSAWASTVQPGAPAPSSPSRHGSVPDTSRPSDSRLRRQSIKPSPPTPTYIPDSPTSSHDTITPTLKTDHKHDLPSVGYTSIFVTLPKTPPVEYTPDRRRSMSRPPAPAIPPSPAPTTSQPRGLSRLLRPKGHSRSKSAVEAPPPPAASSSKNKTKPPPTHTSITREKKSKYAEMRPPQVATELALAQFTGGGTMEHHMNRYAERQAKNSGAATMMNGQLVGVSGLYQDGEGGVWRDQEEEWEYTHLLAGGNSQDASGPDWVQFDEERGVDASDDRRGSVSTQDSDLDPRYTMRASEPCENEMDVSHSRSTAKHLRKTPEFNLDIFPADHTTHHARSRPADRQRRRPEPLDLAPRSSNFSPSRDRQVDPAEIRRDFLESSFSPPPPAQYVKNASSATLDTFSTKRSALKPAMLNVKGLFKAVGGKKSSRA